MQVDCVKDVRAWSIPHDPPSVQPRPPDREMNRGILRSIHRVEDCASWSRREDFDRPKQAGLATIPQRVFTGTESAVIRAWNAISQARESRQHRARVKIASEGCVGWHAIGPVLLDVCVGCLEFLGVIPVCHEETCSHKKKTNRTESRQVDQCHCAAAVSGCMVELKSWTDPWEA